MRETGKISVNSDNLMPIIKKWLYSDRDIFIRELVSNGVDAISKYKKLVEMGEAIGQDSYKVTVKAENNTLVFTDNGIGMTKEEVEKYINQVAFSGAADFLEKYEDAGSSIIGHFGLGFYSAFMVSDKVTIKTLSYKKDAQAVLWESDGSDEYTISDCDKTTVGTEITLYLNDESKDFTEKNNVLPVLEKYCGFMPVEIYFDGEEKAVNDTLPLWLKNPSECTEEEYKAFYHKVFTDFNDPLFWIHLNVDYPFNLKGIIYFPKLTENPESIQGQIKLFNNQVFVADNIKEIIPEFLMLLKGVIDCPDMPLNVSRSFLQNDRTVQQISNHITKKIADRLIGMAKNEKETYEKYWDDINVFIKYGCLREQKFNDRLKEYIIYKTTDDTYVTLEKYLENKEVKEVYYATDKNRQAQYVKMAKDEGNTVVILGGMLDIPFMQHIEMQNMGVRFKRVDASIKGEDVKNHLFDMLCEATKKITGENVEVKAQGLKTKAPAILLLDEYSRRMDEAQRYYGMNNLGGLKYTLLLNTESDLIKNINSMQDENKKQKSIKYVYDLARLSHGSMKAEELSEFVERSAELLEQSTR